ncbi:MAG: alpha/beta fold hydrolase, partial [Methylococcus sp.]
MTDSNPAFDNETRCPGKFPRNRRITAATALFAGFMLSPMSGQTADWTNAGAPVPVLDWKPCTDPRQAGYDCATAKVPLDYQNPGGASIELDVVRHRATDPANRIGSLFWYPGGPGARGTLALPATLQTKLLFPEILRQRFDIIAWDPRGVGATTSSGAVHCFDTPEQEANFLDSFPQGIPLGRAERRAYAQGYRELGERCRARNSALLDHVSTTETVLDLDLLRQAVGDAQLNYQGNSFGTFVGDLYANLFPDRVRALLLVGNMNAAALANRGSAQPFLHTQLRQGADKTSAKTLNAFFSLCAQAGQTRCAFAAESVPKTKTKWKTLLKRVRRQPVTGPSGDSYTYGMLVNVALAGLYHASSWPGTGQLLQDLWEKSGQPPAPPPPPQPNTESPIGSIQQSQQNAIRCLDSPNPRNPAAYGALAELGFARSGDLGRYWVY